MSNPYDRNGQRDNTHQYLRQQIEQAGPVEQVLMLYDGAVRFVMQAKAAIERGDIQARHNANSRAMEIAAYLVDLVDPARGGEAGKALFGIHSALLRRLPQIDFENSVAICDEIVANLKTLRAGLANGLTSQQASKAPPAAAQGGTVVAAPGSNGEAVPAGTHRNAVA